MISQDLSKRIECLRFPLCVMVVFIHCSDKSDMGIPLSDATPVFTLLRLGLSQWIAAAAVPTFFFISGLLFFNNITVFNKKIYKEKIQSRLKSLVLPYIIFNLILYFINLIKEGEYYSLIGIMKALWSVHIAVSNGSLLGSVDLYVPENAPLWFLRDLIVLSFLSPLIFNYAKYKYSIILLAISYFLGIGLSIPGFSIAAFFFFSAGAYVSINNVNIPSIKLLYSLTYLLVSIGILKCFYNSTYFYLLHNLFVIFTPVVMLSISRYFLRFTELLKQLASFIMFIYCFHSILITNFVCNRVCYFLTPYQDYIIIPYISYFISPLIIVTICIFIKLVVNSISDRISKIHNFIYR